MVMIPPLRTMLWSTLSLALSACSVANNDHCGNQEGNATCLQRDPGAPYCSICVADNNGCLAAAPPTGCIAETAPATSADATSSGGTGTTTASTTTAVDPPTSTSTGTTDPTNPTTTTGSSSSTGDTSTSTADSSSGTSTGTSTSTGDTSTGDTSTSTSTGDTSTSTGGTSDTTDGTSTGGPVCGDNKVEGDEVCDGNNFNGESCKTVIPVGKWGGGSLGCNLCMSLNDSKCCVGLNGTCGGLAPDAKLPCCGGLTCKSDGLNGHKCKSL